MVEVVDRIRNRQPEYVQVKLKQQKHSLARKPTVKSNGANRHAQHMLSPENVVFELSRVEMYLACNMITSLTCRGA